MHIQVQKLADDAKPDKATKAPPPPKGQSNLAKLGVTVAVLDAAARTKFKIPGNVQGVAVTAVDAASPAGEKNVRPGDVIVEVGAQAVKTPDDVVKAVDAAAKTGKPVTLLINREGNLTYVGLRLR